MEWLVKGSGDQGQNQEGRSDYQTGRQRLIEQSLYRHLKLLLLLVGEQLPDIQGGLQAQLRQYRLPLSQGPLAGTVLHAQWGLGQG
jgi:hypothetical protein